MDPDEAATLALVAQLSAAAPAAARTGAPRRRGSSGDAPPRSGNHLLGFTNAPHVQESAAKAHLATRRRAPPVRISKEQHVAANFRFSLSPLASPCLPGLTEPDTAVDWAAVEEVFGPAPDRCPVCLEEDLVAPHVTRCGHVFCLVCIVRSGSKCPCCAEQVILNALRPAVAVDAPARPAAGARVRFRLCHREKGSGHVRSGPSEGEAAPAPAAAPLLGLCPVAGAPGSMFSRLVVSSAAGVAARLDRDLAALRAFRAACLEGSETEWLPAVTSAAEVLERRRARWDAAAAAPGAAAALHAADAAAAAAADARARVAAAEREDAAERKKRASAAAYPPAAVAEIAALRAQLAAVTAERDLLLLRGGAAADSAPAPPPPPLAAAAALEAPPPPLDGFHHLVQALTSTGYCFLHGLDVKCLLHEAGGDWRRFPRVVAGPVVEVTSERLTRDLRKRRPFLQHLPLHCDVSFVEVDCRALLSPATKAKFAKELKQRRQQRQGKKNRSEAAASAVNDAPEAPAGSEMLALYSPEPAVPFDLGAEAPAAFPSCAGEAAAPPPPAPAPPAVPATREAGWSFARVSQQNGYFPELAGGAGAGAEAEAAVAASVSPSGTGKGKKAKKRSKGKSLFSTGGARGS